MDVGVIQHERILQFKLTRERDLIHDGYRGLILCALYEKNNQTIEEMNNLISENFFIKEIPYYVLKSYANNLVKDGILLESNLKYTLIDEKINELKEIQNKRLDIKKLIINEIYEIINKLSFIKKTKMKKKDLENVINDIISTFFTRAAKIVAGYIYDEKKLIFDIPELEDIIISKLSFIDEEEQRLKIKESIMDFIKSSTLINEFLYDMFEIYVYFEILNINPETHIKIPITQVYFDTNVLLDLLLPTRNSHRLVNQIVQISKELKIDIKYSFWTNQELMRVIEEYEKAKELSADSLKGWGYTDKDGLIQDYLIEKEENPSLSFEGYCVGLKTRFKNLLLKKYDIKLDETEYDFDDKIIRQIRGVINKYQNIYRSYKSKEAVEHDAYVLELQRNIKSSWLITRDYSLFYISRTLLDQKIIQRPLSVNVNVWIQALNFVRPPLNKKTSIDAFKQFISKPQTSAFSNININRLFAVAFPWIKSNYFTPEDYQEIISTKFIEDHLIIPQDEDSPLLTFENVLPEILDEITIKKVQKLERTNEELKEQIKSLQKPEVKESEIKIKTFFYLGIFTLALLIIMLIGTGLQRFIYSDNTIYAICGLTLIFFAGAIFGENVLDAIKNFPKK